jgi:hypothetical protein
MAKSAAEMVRGAFDRARGRRALVHFLATSAGGFAIYAVDSTADVDTAYRVTVRGAEYRCTCAAEPRPACWHRAAVASVRASRQAFGMPAEASGSATRCGPCATPAPTTATAGRSWRSSWRGSSPRISTPDRRRADGPTAPARADPRRRPA